MVPSISRLPDRKARRRRYLYLRLERQVLDFRPGPPRLLGRTCIAACTVPARPPPWTPLAGPCSRAARLGQIDHVNWHQQPVGLLGAVLCKGRVHVRYSSQNYLAAFNSPGVGLAAGKKNPRQFPAEGLCSNVHDHAIRDRSRDGRGSGTTSCPCLPRQPYRRRPGAHGC